MKFDDNDDSIDDTYFVTHKKKTTNFMIEWSLPIFGWFSFMLDPNTKSQHEGAAKMHSQLPQGGAP